MHGTNKEHADKVIREVLEHWDELMNTDSQNDE